ncbi:MFS transporter [Actinosynnema sp. NPDC023658]|uniref:MFS transporter n=1 Tax=Actinosynnema sp. NPDC023658 TaxID=3155465 RepID=UPI0033C56550
MTTHHTGSPPTSTPTTTPTTRLPRNHPFHLLLSAAAISRFGTSVSQLAVPLTAVAALGASPGQVGVLGALGTASFVLVGLPAGAWVDRLPKRPVMISADLVRAVLLLSLPVAWWLGALTLPHLYLVTFAAGLATVFFDVATTSFLPHVVGRPALMTANSRLVAADAVNDIGGRGVGGFVVQLVGGPLTILVDAMSYLGSALCLVFLRSTEPAAARHGGAGLRREITDGVRFVLGNPVLRAFLTAGVCTNVSIIMINTMLPVVFVRELGLSATALGLYLAVGGVGALIGSLTARRLADRLGHGRALWLAGLWIAPVGFLVPFVDRGALLWAAAASWFITAVKVGVDNVIKVSFRQLVTPPHLLARMNATFRFLLTGALSIGAGLAGLLGELAGPRAALWVGAIGLAVVWVPIYFSPVRSVRSPSTDPDPDPDRPAPTNRTNDPERRPRS